ncbi:MAG: DNA polymerase I [Spirochaetaceae bacterium]|nr:MAG: DNA polymerase I [Spirochaetaceae bacterium]
MRDALYLLDGYSLIYRSYFAFIRQPLRNPRGQNSSAIFGFFRSLLALLSERRPQQFLVVLDSRTPTFRHQKYEAYKATRDKTPEDLTAQIPVIEQMLEALEVPMARVDGYEADDLIATLATACRERGQPCYIVSGDKDLLQLVDGPVRVLRPGRDGFEDLDREGVHRDWGVYPEQILDYLALTGDTSDNVPGVKGIGDKTAARLLNQYGSLEAIYEHIEEISGAVKTRLQDGRDAACLSRDLILLETGVPLQIPDDRFRLPGLNAEAAIPLFLEQGMKSLADQVRQAGGAAAADPDSGTQDADAGVAGPDAAQAELAARGRYTLVTDADELERWIRRARSAGEVAFDTETDGLDSHVARPVGFSLCIEPGAACYVALRGPDGPVVPEDRARELLHELLTDGAVRLIGQNLKYDYQVMRRWGIEISNLWFDTMIAAWVLDAGSSSYGMDQLAETYLGYRTTAYTDILPKTREGQATFDSVDLDTACRYAAEDADVTLRLYRLFAPRIKERGFERLFHDMEMPLVRLLAEMELAGIAIDSATLDDYSRELGTQLEALEREVYDLVGYEFNIASTRQLQQVLFEERKLKPLRKTKTGYSTDTAVLQELAREDPVPAKVLRHRLLAKLKSTYVDALPRMVDPETGRIHTHFNQTGTATGRLSSKDPNLQNIPIRDEEGRRIREAFVPADGHRFVSADYSQIELVVLAHLSGDPGLTAAFREGHDVHRATGALIFGVDPREVSAEQRRIAKTINFGVMYGMSAFRLSRELGIPRQDADRFIEAYFRTYSRIREFIDATVAVAEKNGAVRTLFGRERKVPDINNRNKAVRSGAQRVAVNTPIQGTAADIVKLAMLRIDRRLRDENLASKVILQVHDELIIEAPEQETEAVRALLEQEMTAAVSLDVPLRVSIEVGDSWGRLH